jgi:hypothetical protein
MNLESRNCIKCKKTFKVMTTSKQTHCSGFCSAGDEESKNLWQRMNNASFEELQQTRKQDALQRAAPAVENRLASVTVKSMRIPPLKPGKPNEVKNIEPLIWKRATPDLKPPMKIIEKKEMPIEKLGPKPTRSVNLKAKGSTTRPIKTVSKGTSTSAGNGETQPTGFLVPSMRLEEETLVSMNLLRNTASELHSLMKGLNPHLVDGDENRSRLLDPHRVGVAAEVAKQIISTMRMQLDICKFIKEK